WKDRDGDGILEDAGGHTVSFSLKTNGDNNIRMGMANFIKDDLARVGIRCNPTGVAFDSLISNIREDYDYEAALIGTTTGVPPDPGMSPKLYYSECVTHYWHMKQMKPETPEEARIDQVMSANVGTTDMSMRHQTWTEIQNIVNDQAYVIWLPSLLVKLPIRNKFGNLHPTVIPHRIIWNIERVFVKTPGSRA